MLGFCEKWTDIGLSWVASMNWVLSLQHIMLVLWYKIVVRYEGVLSQDICWPICMKVFNLQVMFTVAFNVLILVRYFIFGCSGLFLFALIRSICQVPDFSFSIYWSCQVKENLLNDHIEKLIEISVQRFGYINHHHHHIKASSQLC